MSAKKFFTTVFDAVMSNNWGLSFYRAGLYIYANCLSKTRCNEPYI